MSFLPGYEFTVQNPKTGEEIPVALRLTAAGALSLNKKFRIKAKGRDDIGESLYDTLLLAVDDIERLMAVLNECLNWKENTNTIHDAMTLFDYMAQNDMLGREGILRLIAGIGRGSGVLTKAEKASLDADINRQFKAVHAAAGEEDEEKNA